MGIACVTETSALPQPALLGRHAPARTRQRAAINCIARICADDHGPMPARRTEGNVRIPTPTSLHMRVEHRIHHKLRPPVTTLTPKCCTCLVSLVRARRDAPPVGWCTLEHALMLHHRPCAKHERPIDGALG